VDPRFSSLIEEWQQPREEGVKRRDHRDGHGRASDVPDKPFGHFSAEQPEYQRAGKRRHDYR
jgi:hypothetical protein